MLSPVKALITPLHGAVTHGHPKVAMQTGPQPRWRCCHPELLFLLLQMKLCMEKIYLDGDTNSDSIHMLACSCRASKQFFSAGLDRFTGSYPDRFICLVFRMQWWKCCDVSLLLNILLCTFILYECSSDLG
ncbi:hypothetical protein XENORESO_005642 [Xenotaenia resolanae]|uniref:Uncharacterized protein n=1 Tax=Xenotaenia resolanae TaxID=208358 RepID=A0ABV0W1W3_9TELE